MSSRGKLKAVFPVVPARDVGKAVRYYVERLGFEVKFQDSKVDPHYVGVRRGGVELHIQFHSDEEFKAGAACRCDLRLEVDDPDAFHEEYRDKDVFHERTKLGDTPWGTREFSLFDLNRNRLTFMRDL